jgi:predicted Zn-dependent peptidase
MRASLLLACALLTLAGATGAAAQGLNLPPVEGFTLGNGIEVQVVRHPVVPMAAIEIWIAAGAVDDPAGQEGLASLTADALRKGAGDRDARAFAEAIDFLGARFSTSVSAERTRLRMNLQSRDLATGLDLLADALLRPAFTDEEVVKLRDQMAESVVSAKENPRNVLDSYHRAHLFAGHPYGRPVDGTEVSLPALVPDAVRAFHRSHFTAGRTQITVAGDVDVDAVRSMLSERFGAMAAGDASRTSVPRVEAPATTSVVLINKNDTPQTWFRIGSTGPSWSDLDDYAATEIVRTVFGGRFTSWLNNALRIEAGLTYGAGWSMWRGSVGGDACLSTFTATETTKEAIELALAQLDRLHEEGLSEADLASAKAYLRGQTPYDYETAMAIAASVAEMKFHGIDRALVDDLFANIDAVTLEDCHAAVERWFTRDDLQITAIGVADEVEEILAAFGPVTRRENTDVGYAPVPPADQSR